MTVPSFARAGRPRVLAAAVAGCLTMTATFSQALACACGCGVFDVGASTFGPNDADTGVSMWFRYSTSDQSVNYAGRSVAPAWMNADKRITTQFLTFGLQYAINREWSVMIEAPFVKRSFTTVWDDTTGAIGNFRLNAFGDVKLMGVYSGFVADRSLGLIFGVKLPTGLWTSPTYGVAGQVFDRDTLPGTGSTDLIIGAYYFGSFGADGRLGYFVQGTMQFPVAAREDYWPGKELNASAGLTYDLGAFGPVTKVAPVGQIIASVRTRDTNGGQPSLDTGYERLFLSPGVDIRIGKMKLYADVEFPVYQRFNHGNYWIDGNAGQLVSPVHYKLQVGYDF